MSPLFRLFLVALVGGVIVYIGAGLVHAGRAAMDKRMQDVEQA
jgi:hypothetical protein